MTIKKELFGKNLDGKNVDIYTIQNSKGAEVKVTNYGGIITSILVPNKKGQLSDVVLGFDNLEDYIKKNNAFFGAIIGRHANRIKNACFTLNGKEYKLEKNDGINNLHGGSNGFDKALWEGKILSSSNSLELTYLSKDGEAGFPGNLNVKVIYSLTEENELKIDYYAISDKDTVVNLTNHSYFNLSGDSSKDVLNNKVWIYADKFTTTDKESIPTGEILDVEGTPMDFRNGMLVGEKIDSNYDQIVFGSGYDHNWVINGKQGQLKKTAKVFDEISGRCMEVYTTKPGVQFYTANFLNKSIIGKNKTAYDKRVGLCLETQFFPNSLEHENFPSPILRKGEDYHYTTIYKFTVE